MLRSDDTFGRYRIEAVAKVGGSSVVYRAREVALDRRVALKVRARDRDDEDDRARFVGEGLHAARLEHPNIVPVYAAGEERGRAYLAMRWIEGTDLEGLVAAAHPLPVERVVGLIAQVARALDFAHGQGLVHRDVKPANVLVAPSGHAYLTDFGLTRDASGSGGLTRTGQLLGTLDYMAPEQITGDAISGATDVYALGALTFKALTGRVPFERGGEVARIWAHVNEAPPSLRAWRPEVPAGIDTAVQRAMRKAPQDRPASAGAFALRLRQALTVHEPRPARRLRPSRFARGEPAVVGSSHRGPAARVGAAVRAPGPGDALPARAAGTPGGPVAAPTAPVPARPAPGAAVPAAAAVDPAAREGAPGETGRSAPPAPPAGRRPRASRVAAAAASAVLVTAATGAVLAAERPPARPDPAPPAPVAAPPAAPPEAAACAVPGPAASTSPAVRARARTLRGAGYRQIRAGRYDTAVGLFGRAADVSTTAGDGYASALFGLARALRLAGRPDDGLVVIERRVELAPRTVNSQTELARARAAVARQD